MYTIINVHTNVWRPLTIGDVSHRLLQRLHDTLPPVAVVA